MAAIYSLYIINKSGGLIFYKDYGSAGRMDTNDSLRLASLWHSMHAISQQLSPVSGCSGIELLQADTFDLHCFQSLTVAYKLCVLFLDTFLHVSILDSGVLSTVINYAHPAPNLAANLYSVGNHSDHHRNHQSPVVNCFPLPSSATAMPEAIIMVTPPFLYKHYRTILTYMESLVVPFFCPTNSGGWFDFDLLGVDGDVSAGDISVLHDKHLVKREMTGLYRVWGL
ncbi:Transport protein particle subunit trs23 [Sesamum angolense]|uniref:Trafficking protein particle complex subunit n=1 Tax=Sesamum angolense TaxID=2727404 RepID=A0AAE1WZF1_9LAMI|nr:Transport protein particle subunit trs23 [Sesamum angolense]